MSRLWPYLVLLAALAALAVCGRGWYTTRVEFEVYRGQQAQVVKDAQQSQKEQDDAKILANEQRILGLEADLGLARARVADLAGRLRSADAHADAIEADLNQLQAASQGRESSDLAELVTLGDQIRAAGDQVRRNQEAHNAACARDAGRLDALNDELTPYLPKDAP